MVTTILIRKGTYRDSVSLMRISREVKMLEGVEEVFVFMSTDPNKALLDDAGFADPRIDEASASDLVIAVRAAGEEAAREAAELAEEGLDRSAPASGGDGGGPVRPASLREAIEQEPDADLAVISVPGPFAAREARAAIRAGRHVMLFSDNVPVAEEVALKREAGEAGLLMMGPDCGTAILCGRPLGFANRIADGPVGIAGASGTGIQEVSCLVDLLGTGVRHAIGTGGRDLSVDVGGAMMLQAIAALAEDPRTRVVAVISKPPDESIAEKVIAALGGCGKPAVVHFVGRALQDSSEAGTPGSATLPPNVAEARTLEEAAVLACRLAAGGPADPGKAGQEESTLGTVILPDSVQGGKAIGKGGPDGQAATCSLEEAASRLSGRLGSGQRYLRGLFCGGTLADEAMAVLTGPLGDIRSNTPLPGRPSLADPLRSENHTVVDMGDDFFTGGRPHPMIDPGPRCDRIAAEAADPETAVILLDLVLGHGSHPDPAGLTANAVREALGKARSDGRDLAVIASVTGTDADVQPRADQVQKLLDAGVVVVASNVRAARLAGMVIGDIKK